MAVYMGNARSITPSTTDDNFSLAAGASEQAQVICVGWGGEATSSTAMATRVARSSGQTGSATLITAVEKAHPYHVANTVRFVGTFATTQPTLEAGDFLATSWNAHGGVVRYLCDPQFERWILIGAATELCISCRNSVGTGTSSYFCTWEEM